MTRYRITVSEPVRYGKLPNQPTRECGPVLNPGDVLELSEMEMRHYRFVRTELSHREVLHIEEVSATA